MHLYRLQHAWGEYIPLRGGEDCELLVRSVGNAVVGRTAELVNGR